MEKIPVLPLCRSLPRHKFVKLILIEFPQAMNFLLRSENNKLMRLLLILQPIGSLAKRHRAFPSCCRDVGELHFM